MPTAPDLESLRTPVRMLRPARDGRILSALPSGEAGAPYDRRVATYDRMVGSRAYNRLAWGTSPAHYRDFAAEALAAGDGLFLDAGCGTASATAALYRGASRPLVLLDRSVDMLERAADRLAVGGSLLLQADLLDLPFVPGHFVTVACFGVLHVLDDPWAALKALRDQLAPGGRIFESYVPRALAGLSRSLPWKVAMMVLRPRPRRRELRILTVSR